ncbi:MAG: hypothetical protein HYX87_07405 [Chloroflexi bacterium]|nr:hypothetical protein [Chloroflexota bacterium]
MSKLRIVYMLSLMVLAVLIAFTVFRPMATGGQYSEVARENLLEREDEWIIQFDIINREGKPTEYVINVSVAGKQFSDRFIIADGSLYTYVYHIRRDMLGSGEATVTVYKEGESTPFEQTTYYLK